MSLPSWFAYDADDDPERDCPHLVCPTCGCPDIALVGHAFVTRADEPDLVSEHDLRIEFIGACDHFWMIFLGDMGGHTLLDIVAAPRPKRPRMHRRISTDRRWKRPPAEETP